MNAEAIVLRTWPIREADQIVALFTREFGKVKGVAKAAAKSRRRFGGALEPMTHVRASFVEKPSRDRADAMLAAGDHVWNGGIFLFRSSALAFARRASRPFGCATVLPSERFELDVENQGNPLIGYLKPLLRLLTSARSGRTGNGA